MAFWDGDNFRKALAGGHVHMSDLQKLFKNFPHLEKLHFIVTPSNFWQNFEQKIILLTCNNTIRKMNLCFTTPKGHIKPKVDWHSVDSPKNCTNEFVLFAFLLFTPNKTNLFVCFLRESMTRELCFWFYLTFIISK